MRQCTYCYQNIKYPRVWQIDKQYIILSTWFKKSDCLQARKRSWINLQASESVGDFLEHSHV